MVSLMKNIGTFMEALSTLRSTVYGLHRENYMRHIDESTLPIVDGVYNHGKSPRKFHDDYSAVRRDIPRTTFSDGFGCRKADFEELLAHILYPMVEFKGYIQGMSNMCGTILRMHLAKSKSFEDVKKNIKEIAGDCYMILCKFVIPFSIDDPRFETVMEYKNKTDAIARALYPDLFCLEEAAMVTFCTSKYLDAALRWFSTEYSFKNTVKIFNHLISHETYQPFLFFMATREHAVQRRVGEETDSEQNARVDETIATCEAYAHQLGRLFDPLWTVDDINALITELQRSNTPLAGHCKPQRGYSDRKSKLPRLPLDWSTVDTSEAESPRAQSSESTWCDLGAEVIHSESTWCDLGAEVIHSESTWCDLGAEVARSESTWRMLSSFHLDEDFVAVTPSFANPQLLAVLA